MKLPFYRGCRLGAELAGGVVVVCCCVALSLASPAAWAQDEPPKEPIGDVTHGPSDEPADCRLLLQLEDPTRGDAHRLLLTLDERLAARGFDVIDAGTPDKLLTDEEAAAALRREHDVTYLLVLQALPLPDHVAIRIEFYTDEHVDRTYATTVARAYSSAATVDLWLAAARAICPGVDRVRAEGEAIAPPPTKVKTREMIAKERAGERERRAAADVEPPEESQFHLAVGMNLNRQEQYSMLGPSANILLGKSPSGIAHHIDIGFANFGAFGGYDADATEYATPFETASLKYGLGYGVFDSDGDSIAVTAGLWGRALFVFYDDHSSDLRFSIEPQVGVRGNSGILGYAITYGQLSGLTMFFGFQVLR